jgi:hypothetical protein
MKPFVRLLYPTQSRVTVKLIDLGTNRDVLRPPRVDLPGTYNNCLHRKDDRLGP